MPVCRSASCTYVTDKGEISKHASPHGAPFLRVEFDNGTVVLMTTGLADLISEAAKHEQRRESLSMRDA